MKMTLEERGELERLLEVRDTRTELLDAAAQAVNKARNNLHDAHHAVLARVNALMVSAYDAGRISALPVPVPLGTDEVIYATPSPFDTRIAGESHLRTAREVFEEIETTLAALTHTKGDKGLPHDGCSCTVCCETRALASILTG